MTNNFALANNFGNARGAIRRKGIGLTRWVNR